MSISSLQNIDYLISNTNSVTNKSTPQVKEDMDVTSFSKILSVACGNSTDVSGMFQSAFSNYNVQTRLAIAMFRGNAGIETIFRFGNFLRKAHQRIALIIGDLLDRNRHRLIRMFKKG